MGVDEATERMLESTGMKAMETSSGIEAFYQGLASQEFHVMVMEGTLRKLYAIFSDKAIDGTESLEEEIAKGKLKRATTPICTVARR